MSEHIPSPRTKACSKCGAEKALAEFAKASWCADGRRGQCKACRRVGGSRADVTEKRCGGCDAVKPVAEFQRRAATPDGYHERCRECRNAYRRMRYPEEREAIQASVKEWRSKNPDKVLEAAKRWARENPDRRADYHHRRRARMLSGSVGDVDLNALWAGVCPLCGTAIDRQLAHPDPMSKSLDHITPLSLGGSHEQSNLQWTHLRCNTRKGNRPAA